MSSEINQTAAAPNPDIARLIRLQELDAVIGQLNEVILRSIPGQIKELEDHFVNDQARLKAFDAESAALNKKKRDLEAEVEDNKSKIARAKQKLHEVKTNVEYRAIVKETDNFEERIKKIDDEQLALMEKMEDHASKRPAILKQVEEDKARLNAMKAEKEVELAAHGSKLDAAKAERAGLIATITPEVLSTYDKIRGQRGGVGVARVRDGSCVACFQIIPPQLYYHIRTSDGIYQCPHCNRYMYYIPEPKVEKEAAPRGGKKKKE